MIVLFVLVGLGRGSFGEDWVTRPRYMYESVAFLMVAIGPVLGKRLDVLSDADRWVRSPVAVLGGALLVLAVATGISQNISQLREGAAILRGAAGELRAQIALADLYGSSLPSDPPRSSRYAIPPPAVLAGLIDRYGSPAHDVLLPSDVGRPNAIERDRALWRLVGGTLEPTNAGELPGFGSGSPSPVLAVDDAVATSDGQCQMVTPVAGGQQRPGIVVAVPDGGSLVVEADATGIGSLGMGRDAPPDSVDRFDVELVAGSPVTVRAPRLGDGIPLRIIVVFPKGTAAARVCATGD